jgi:hypothetical protein
MSLKQPVKPRRTQQLAKLRENMETRQFLRSLVEARRRYSGPVSRSTATIQREPAPRHEPDDEPQPPATEEDEAPPSEAPDEPQSP